MNTITASEVMERARNTNVLVSLGEYTLVEIGGVKFLLSHPERRKLLELLEAKVKESK